MSEEVPLEGLLESRMRLLLSYPRYSEERGERMVEALRGLGVEALVPRGPHVLEGVEVLGKGHTGVVVAARLSGEVVALKIMRVDAGRGSLEGESACLGVANGVGVGPRLVGASRELLAMELVEGEYPVEWVEGLGEGDADRLRDAFSVLLVKGWRLDSVGLDHGELSRAHRHIIVSEEGPRIVDFESASTERRCSNVTSLAQYLFFNHWMRGAVGGVIELPERGALLGALSTYKRRPSWEGLRTVLEVSGLTA